jgi:hypothetical protein
MKCQRARGALSAAACDASGVFGATSFEGREVFATDAVLQLGVQADERTYLIFVAFQLMQPGKTGFGQPRRDAR